MVKMLNYDLGVKLIINSINQFFSGVKSIHTEYKTMENNSIENDEIMKKIGNPDISISLQYEIDRIANNKVAKAAYIAMGRYSEKLVRWTMYYMTHQNVNKVRLCKEDREFINTLSYYSGYGKIYEFDGCRDISEYDICQSYGVMNSAHIIYLPEIKHRFLSEDFSTRWKVKLASKHILDTDIPAINTTKVGNDGLIHPAFTIIGSTGGTSPTRAVENLIMPKQPSYMSNDLFALYDREFSKLLAGKDYSYYASGDLWYLRVSDKYATNDFIIDDGSIAGVRRPHMLCKYQSILASGEPYISTTFVPVATNLDIIAKVLSMPMYTLSQAELDKVYSEYPIDAALTNHFDFTNSGHILESIELVNNGKEVFAKYLKAIEKTMEGYGFDCRLRFIEFKGISSFTVVSDKYTRSPLLGMPPVKDGIKIIVAGELIDTYDGEKLLGRTKINFVEGIR